MFVISNLRCMANDRGGLVRAGATVAVVADSGTKVAGIGDEYSWQKRSGYMSQALRGRLHLAFHLQEQQMERFNTRNGSGGKTEVQR